MSDEQHATLRTVFDTLGMKEKAVAPVPHSEKAATPPNLIQNTEFPSFSAPHPGHNIFTGSSGVGFSNRSHDLHFEGYETGISEDSPDSILNAWDFDLGVGGYNPPITSNLQHIIDSSPQDGLGVRPEEQIPSQLSSTGLSRSNDASTPLEKPTRSPDIEGLVDEISDCVGTLKIGPGGSTRFYGPTSTFNLKDMQLSDSDESERKITTFSSESNDEIPASLEAHLLGLYFSWQDPTFHVVDRHIYEEAQIKWNNMEDTPFYSEALRNAMCALGSAFESRYHPTFVTFPKTLVEFFGDRAKSLLEIELDRPCVATVQALVILSNHEIGNGKDARGWLYRMALRLAFDLALHLDMSSYVSQGSISVANADIRRNVFWTAYIVDHQLGFHLGRPFRTSMEDVTVGKPRQITGLRGHCQWVPYDSSTLFGPDSGLLDNKEAIGQQLVSLCELMAPCGYILYGTSKISKDVLQELNAKIVSELRKWKAKLPPTLQINLGDFTTPYLPHVLLLHMQYHQNIIYAHRPWMSKSHLQPQPPKGPGYTHAREMCIQSAIAISKILTMYETRYTLRLINVKAVSVTSSAILLLLFAAVSNHSTKSNEDISFHLNTCFRALDEFSLSWKSAQRAKDLLISLQRQWELRTRSQTDTVAWRADAALALFTPRKRSKGEGDLGALRGQDEQMEVDFDCMLGGMEKDAFSSKYCSDFFELISNPG
ncbi:hypothetical protein N7466_002442 [Penicillium verhagenii]|uniref:uncharacterized protein n=1 Tax=Penicillium verhagenii TaxID=1562060 RepID=UPI002544D8BF|nr:uncharacterized protein N7466_002442 [Penicillium verhagenii]KAJ5939308.1 hypothetical protein N7466_002442 [Penicillium verhagenii]